MTAIDTVMADRRRQWQQMTPERRTQAVQAAIVGTLDHVRWMRQQARQRTAARLAAQPVRVREYDRI